jgi:hypothetical protein
MSQIEWRQLRNLTAREIVSALIRDGFVSITSAALTSVIVTLTVAGSRSHSIALVTPFRSERFVR